MNDERRFDTDNGSGAGGSQATAGSRTAAAQTAGRTPEGLQEQLGAIMETAAALGERRPVGHPPREALDRELREVKENVLRMGSIVASQISAAIEALVSHDAEAATAVIIGDGRVNEVQRHISTVITTAIATQQPVARDLRFLMALDHVSYELERMGDHAASVAKQARKLAPLPPLKKYVDLPQMGELAARQVHMILRALVDVDEAEARIVAAGDDDMDDLYHRIFDEVLALMRADSQNVDPGTRLLFAAHYLERIGDRVTNIAEDVVFLATGDVEDLNP